MDRIKLVLLASGIALSVAGCADMMGGGSETDTMEPAAGPTMSEDPMMEPGVGGVEGPTAGGESDDSQSSPVN